MKTDPPSIDDLLSENDTLGLLGLLRLHPDPQVRVQVAQRLPELDSTEVVEGLIRSHKLDPDSQVKRQARAALQQIFGSNSAQVIAAYGEIDPDDREFESALEDAISNQDPNSNRAWSSANRSEETDSLLSPAANPDSDADPSESNWTPDHISALISILTDDRHFDRQIKALNALAQNLNLESINAISSAALWSENALIRQQSNHILAEIYGDGLQAYLAEFQQADQTDPDLDEMDLEEAEASPDNQEETGPAIIPTGAVDYNQSSSLPSTHQTEPGINGFQILLVIVLLVIMAWIVKLVFLQ